jgi:hypothetical protein
MFGSSVRDRRILKAKPQKNPVRKFHEWHQEDSQAARIVHSLLTLKAEAVPFFSGC